MKDNYVEYVKIERKINEVNAAIEAESMKKSQSMKTLTTFGINYIFKTVIGFILFLVIVFNRKTPVIIFSEEFNFDPFSSIISYPSKITNAISVPFWAFINNYFFRQVASRVL